MLAAIFVEEEPEPAPAPPPKASVTSSAFAGLDVPHSDLLIRLLAGPMSRTDFDALATELRLMPDGAIETLNEWGFDTLGEPIVEDDDDVRVASEGSCRLSTIRRKDRDLIIQALSAGVVPRVGLQHIQVGRSQEVGALVRDIDRIADAGSAVRFVIGEYGAGKTFFLNLIRLIALERKCVTVHADLAPDRRLHATGGQARGLYAEAIRNMATRTKPEGGALPSIVERFVTECVREAEDGGSPVERIIDRRLAPLLEMLGGHDFSTVLKTYWRAHEEGDDSLKAAALRWLRAEYPTKTEARQALPVRSIIDDADVYDTFKLLSAFVRIAGYSGLLVVFDEMVNLYKLQSSQARNQNYEQLLRMLNDVLQGNVEGLGFVFGGTPEFLLDSRR
ncbi:hypothetical protein LTR94_026854, partial [Friedmanniomyces endolithicus]